MSCGAIIEQCLANISLSCFHFPSFELKNKKSGLLICLSVRSTQLTVVRDGELDMHK